MTESSPDAGAAVALDAGRHGGTVGDFDELVGLGHIDVAGRSAPGGGRLRFHCTQIADGSRSIPVGIHVSFVVIPGRGGSWEAGDVRPSGSGRLS